MSKSLSVSYGKTNPSCFYKVRHSKWVDGALLVSGIVFLIIGTLATCGILNSMGAANALHLSFGMYAAAAVLLVTGIVKLFLNFCENRKSTVQTKYTNTEAPVTKATVTHRIINNTDPQSSRKTGIDVAEIDKKLRLEKEEAKAVDLKIKTIEINQIKNKDGDDCPYECKVTLVTDQVYSAELPREEIRQLLNVIEKDRKIKFGLGSSYNKLGYYDLQTTSHTALTANQILEKLIRDSK